MSALWGWQEHLSWSQAGLLLIVVLIILAVALWHVAEGLATRRAWKALRKARLESHWATGEPFAVTKAGVGRGAAKLQLKKLRVSPRGWLVLCSAILLALLTLEVFAAAPGEHRIYAMFTCTPNLCVENEDFVYDTLVECQQRVVITTKQMGVHQISGIIWFECRSKHVDLWEYEK